MSALHDDMAQGMQAAELSEVSHAPKRTIVLPWQRLLLGVIAALAAVLDFYQLDQLGYGNSYYAAAVRSMLQSWHNFFFVSFDPGGFVTIDKPPLGFWVETASAKLLGYNGVSLLLPQAVAGVLSVLVLYHLVARAFGAPAGLIAGLALAVTPISVVGNRSNNIDSMLVLVVLLAAWAMLKAAEAGSLRWLLLGAVLLGLGFNVKTMQAYLVLPAFAALYALAAATHWRVRLAHLALALLVLLGVSFSWIAAVDLTPAGARPYVGSSCTNSELNLALGYNGLSRLTGGLFTTCAASETSQQSTTQTGSTGASQPAGGPGGPGGGGPGGFGENGTKGPFRLFNEQLGGQIGWLLPLALIGLVVAALQLGRHALVDRRRLRLSLDRRGQSLILWGIWLLAQAAFFSVAGFFHAYYLVMMAPAIAALSGIGVTALWREYRRSDGRGWLLPAALLAVAAVQVYLLSPYPDWNRWLTPLIVAGALIAAVVLARGRLGGRLPLLAPLGAAAVGVGALLAAPAVWAGYTVQHGAGGGLGQAGPQSSGRFGLSGGRGFGRAGGGDGGPFGGGAGNGFSGSDLRALPGLNGGRGGGNGSPRRGDFGQQVNPRLLAYLEQHQGTTKFLLAVTNSMAADPYIITTGKPVMALGGFAGSDEILTTAKLAQLVKNGTVRYFQPGGFGGPGFGAPPARLLEQLPAGMRAQIEAGQGPFGGSGASDRRGRGFGRMEANAALMTWVRTNCAVVPAGAYQSAQAANQASGDDSGFGGNQLYDCSAKPVAAQASTAATPSQSSPAAADPLPKLTAAMARVSSYQASISSTISGLGGTDGMGSATTLTAVRKGSAFEEYTVTTTHAPFGVTTTYSIVAGGKTCRSGNAGGPYTCRAGTDPSAAPNPGTQAGSGGFQGGNGGQGGFGAGGQQGRQGGFGPGGARGGPGGFGGFGSGGRLTADPSTSLQGAHFTRAAARVIGGQACDGYSYTLQDSRGTSSGTIYVARSTGLPCEQNATLSRQSPLGSGAITTETITLWSRFDDTGLRVPAVPN